MDGISGCGVCFTILIFLFSITIFNIKDWNSCKLYGTGGSLKAVFHVYKIKNKTSLCLSVGGAVLPLKTFTEYYLFLINSTFLLF